MQQYQPLLALKYSCLKNLGTLNLKAGDNAKAFDFFLEALQLDDTDTALLYKVGCLAEKLDNFDVATAAFYEVNFWIKSLFRKLMIFKKI
jgi:calcineurin-binding protein cabin-1